MLDHLKDNDSIQSDILIANPSSESERSENLIDESDDTASFDTSLDAVSSDESYAFVEFLEFDFTEDLKEFYKHYILETPDGLIQIFQSMTYGEMMISFLLLVLIVLYVMRWIYDVLF